MFEALSRPSRNYEGDGGVGDGQHGNLSTKHPIVARHVSSMSSQIRRISVNLAEDVETEANRRFVALTLTPAFVGRRMAATVEGDGRSTDRRPTNVFGRQSACARQLAQFERAAERRACAHRHREHKTRLVKLDARRSGEAADDSRRQRRRFQDESTAATTAPTRFAFRPSAAFLLGCPLALVLFQRRLQDKGERRLLAPRRARDNLEPAEVERFDCDQLFNLYYSLDACGKRRDSSL